jgi:outer membrane protein assembly factor BamB
MAYSKRLHIRLSVVALSVLAAMVALSAAECHAAARKYPKRNFTSQESRGRPAQYRRDELYGVSDAWRRFKVDKDRISKLKKSSFWNKRPFQFSTPLVVGERLFVGCDAGVFYAFRVPNEKRLWKFKTEGPVQSKPAFANGTVYFGDGKGIFYALDSETGEQKWTATLDTEILAAPLILGSTIYIPTMSGRMYALDAASGAEFWHTPPDEKEFGFSIRRSSSPTEGLGLIFQGTATGDMRALRQSDGSKVWETRLGSPQNRVYDVDSKPLLHEGQLFAASADGLLYSLNPSNGAVNWVSDAGGANDIIYKSGRIYSSGGSNLYCIDPGTGLIFWSQDFEKPYMSSPAAGDGFIAIVSTIDKIYIVESATGDIAYERYVRKGSLGDPIVVDDKYVYVLSNSGRLFAFEVTRVEPKQKKRKKVAKGVTEGPSIMPPPGSEGLKKGDITIDSKGVEKVSAEPVKKEAKPEAQAEGPEETKASKRDAAGQAKPETAEGAKADAAKAMEPESESVSE